MRNIGVSTQASTASSNANLASAQTASRPERAQSNTQSTRMPYRLAVVPVASRSESRVPQQQSRASLASFQPRPVPSSATSGQAARSEPEGQGISSMERALLDARLNLQPVQRDYLGHTARFGDVAAGTKAENRVLQALQAFAKDPGLLTKERAADLQKQLNAVSLSDPEQAETRQRLVDHLTGITKGAVPDRETVGALRPVVKDLQRHLDGRQPALDRALDSGRAQSQLRANQTEWNEVRTQHLSEAAGKDKSTGYNPSHVTVRDAVVEGVHNQALVRNGLGKFPHNITPIVNGAVNSPAELFRGNVPITQGAAYTRFGFTSFYYTLGAIQSLISAKSAHTSMKAADKALNTFQSESKQFLEMQKEIAELAALSRIVKDVQKSGGSALTVLDTAAQAVTAGKITQKGLGVLLHGVFRDLSPRAVAALEAYVKTDGGTPETSEKLTDLRNQVALHYGETSSSDQEHLSGALDHLNGALKLKVREADKAHKSLTGLVANYGKDAVLAKAMREDYKNQMKVNIFSAEVWGLALFADGLGIAQKAVSSNVEGASLVVNGLGIASSVANVGVGVLAIGLSAYDASVNAIRAYKHHQTGKKAEALHRLFSQEQEVPVSGLEGSRKVSEARDAELAMITQTLASNQSTARNTKIGQAILSSVDGLGFAALTASAIAGVVATATGGALAAGAAAAAGPVGFAIGGAFALGTVAFASVRAIKWGIHRYQSKQLQKVISGDPQAMQKYARKHNIGAGQGNSVRQSTVEAEVKKHAIDTLTRHSTKFALNRFHQRLTQEISQVDMAHWDQSPAIAVMKCFFDEPAQIQAIASLGTDAAVKVLAKTFQVRT